MIKAKPIIKDKFWILQDEQKKIGSVEQSKNGYVVQINGNQNLFKNLKTISNQINVVFENSLKNKVNSEFQVNGFPTDSKPYNPVYNVKERLPIFTKKNKSKSWYAAGYYMISINGNTEVHFCPKLILLQRYEYKGPVYTPDGFEYK